MSQKNDLRFSISYSKEIEFRSSMIVIDNLNFFKAEGYSKNHYILPSNKNMSSKDLKKLIDKKFDEEKYEKAKLELLKNSRKINNLICTLDKIFCAPKRNYKIMFSVYGTGGSYYPPNAIMVNIRLLNMFETVSHELVHLYIERFVKKYNISHWQKERTVDLILHSKALAFINYSNWQKNYFGAEEIDEIFQRMFFLSPEKYFAKLSKKHPIEINTIFLKQS